MTDQPRGAGPAGGERPQSAHPGESGASLYGRRSGSDWSGGAAPPPEKKRGPSRLGMMSGFLSFLLAVALLAGVAVVLADRAARAPGPLSTDKVVYIQQGSDSDEIIDELQTQGVIESPLLFRIALLAEGARSRLKAGEYLFKQGVSAQGVIDLMVSGKAILHAITIPEGLTSDEVVQRLLQDDLLVGDIREIPREGALLPETYKFHRGDRRDKILKKMERDQKQLVDSVWGGRASDLPLASPFEMVTLASIVEKETGKPDERPMVAAVFLNRLRKHMRLQSDPTIIYGLAGGKGSLGRPLTHADVESQTAYNTYVIDGLPPGPIANPGRASLEAVANPAPTKDLYFVADGTGGHVFSETLGEHNRNVQHLREIEQNNKAGPPAAPGAPAAPAAPAGHDDHSEIAPAPNFGAAPSGPEFFARHDPAPPPPSLDPDPRMVALVAPLMPGAPPPPHRLADLDRDRAGATATPEFAALGDMEMAGITKAENELDGPVDDPAPETRAGAAAAPGDLDGPAEPVQTSGVGSALSYAGGIVNAAPNGKARIYDAAAGTALDPLLEKNWDLNNAQTVDLPEPKARAEQPGTATKKAARAKTRRHAPAQSQTQSQPQSQARAQSPN